MNPNRKNQADVISMITAQNDTFRSLVQFMIAPALRRLTIRKSLPTPAPGHSDVPCASELRRLAETSSHLLEDVGFVRDKTNSWLGQDSWKSATLRLMIVFQDCPTAVSVRYRENGNDHQSATDAHQKELEK